MSKDKEQYKRMIRSVIAIVLIACQTFIYWYVWLHEYNDKIVLPFNERGHWLVLCFYIMFQFLFLYLFGGLKIGYMKRSNIIFSQVLAMFATHVVMYMQIVLLAAKLVNPVPMLYVTLLDVFVVIVISTLSEWLFRVLFPAKRTLVLYDEYEPHSFVEKMNSRKDKFKVESVIKVSEDIDSIKEHILQSECVVLYDIHSELRNKLLKLCYEHDIRTYSTVKVSDILIRGAESMHMFDTPLLLNRNNGLSIEQRFIKRTMDIVVSLIMLIIFSPFMIISAIAIKLYDGGPVFFRQERYTVGEKKFRIHKFRSMIVDADKGGKARMAEDNDPRITPVGKVLRATRLDELPQLIDILTGKMSLVGPRPEAVEFAEKYVETLPEFKYRMKVKGGLTGYAQVYGKYNTSPYDKIQLDLIYIQNYSFFLDLKLILLTFKIMFMKESTEGAKPETASGKDSDKVE